MKIAKNYLRQQLLFAAIATVACAQEPKVEAYAHPTLFGTQSQNSCRC